MTKIQSYTDHVFTFTRAGVVEALFKEIDACLPKEAQFSDRQIVSGLVPDAPIVLVVRETKALPDIPILPKEAPDGR